MTAEGPLSAWLAYGHPAWMVVALAVSLAALRTGLAQRRARRARGRTPEGRRRHLRLAKPAVLLVLAGFAGGPLSVWTLRDWTAFSTFHGLVGGIAAVLFVGAALQGRRLERGERDARQLHAWLGAAAVGTALAAAIAGFVLLP